MASATRYINGFPVERRKVADLKAAPYNPRTITDSALAGLGASIDRFGLPVPIIENKQTGNIVGGHQRIKALLKKGTKYTDVIVVDLPIEREQALNIALNNRHIQGDFDDEKLDALLAELGNDFPDLQLERLLKSTGGATFDVTPETNINAVTSRYEILISCTDEVQQRELFNTLVHEGRKVKVMQK